MVSGLVFFCVMMAMWAVMIYYTVVPWLLGYTLPVDGSVDISVLTWTLVIFSLVSLLLVVCHATGICGDW